MNCDIFEIPLQTPYVHPAKARTQDLNQCLVLKHTLININTTHNSINTSTAVAKHSLFKLGK